MEKKKRIKVYVPRAYGDDTPLGGWVNFYFTKKEAKAVVQRYIDNGIIEKGWVETAFYEQ